MEHSSLIAAPPPAPTTNSAWSVQTITHIQRWTPSLWTLRLTRPAGFTFAPGHYTRLGLPVDEESRVWRAYSIVSAPDEAELEFLIGLIPDGEFCTRLAPLDVGDSILLDARAMGFFIASQLPPGDSLWLLATGSGIGPYISLLREQQMLRAWQNIVVLHSVRQSAELAYAEELRALAAGNEHLRYEPIVTREATSRWRERIPQLLQGGELEEALGLPLQPSAARAMVCGNPDFTAEMRRVLAARGFMPVRRGLTGTMLFENYW